MEVRLAATTPTAGDDAVVRILIAIELSKKSWIAGANTPLKAKTSRHLRGEPDACSVVRVPGVEEEDAKRLHRERKRLLSERVQHVNRIKGLCALHGIYDYQALRTNRKTQFGGLRTGRPPAAPASRRRRGHGCDAR